MKRRVGPSHKERSRCPECTRRITISKAGRMRAHMISPGKPCPMSEKYILDRPKERKRPPPYCHPEPRLIGERTTQQSPTGAPGQAQSRYRKKNWQSYKCAGCGELKWILGGTLARIIRDEKVTLDQLRCYPCRRGVYQASRDKVAASITNLARRRRELKLKKEW